MGRKGAQELAHQLQAAVLLALGQPVAQRARACHGVLLLPAALHQRDKIGRIDLMLGLELNNAALAVAGDALNAQLAGQMLELGELKEIFALRRQLPEAIDQLNFKIFKLLGRAAGAQALVQR